MTARRLAVLVTGAVLLAGCGGARQTPSAAEQVPRLGVVLDRVDHDLAAHHYQAARTDLRTMKAAVVRARAAGELRDADAARVLDAVEQLISRLPSATTTSGPTATSTESSRPSPSASSKPSHPRTTRTPSAPPTTASASPTSAPTAPSSAPTAPTTTAAAQVSPAAATSSATP